MDYECLLQKITSTVFYVCNLQLELAKGTCPGVCVRTCMCGMCLHVKAECVMPSVLAVCVWHGSGAQSVMPITSCNNIYFLYCATFTSVIVLNQIHFGYSHCKGSVLSLQHSVAKKLQSSRELQSLMNHLLTRCSPVLVDTEGIQCLTEMAVTTLGRQDSEEEEEEAIVDILKVLEVSTRHSHDEACDIT